MGAADLNDAIAHLRADHADDELLKIPGPGKGIERHRQQFTLLVAGRWWLATDIVSPRAYIS